MTCVPGGASYLTITSDNATPTAGVPFNVTITAYDDKDNVKTDYDESVTTYVFSGPADALDGTVALYPNQAAIEAAFSNGVASGLSVTLYKAETVDLDVTDGTVNTFGDISYDVELTIGYNPTVSGADSLISASPIWP